MRAFQYYMKTEVVFGEAAESKTAALVQKHGGSRVLVVYGGGSAVRSGLLDRICGQLQDCGIAHETFGGVQPMPAFLIDFIVNWEVESYRSKVKL